MAETHLDGAGKPPAPGSPGAGALVPIMQRLVTWGADGNPVVRTSAVFSKQQIGDLQMAAASSFFTDPNDELAIAIGLPPSEFYGMTNLEVMLIKQARYAATSGEREYINDVLDRLQGKAKTTAEVHSTVETYEQFLARVGRAAAAKAKPVNGVHEAEIIPPAPRAPTLEDL